MKKLYITELGREDVSCMFGTSKCILETLMNGPCTLLELINKIRRERIEYKYVKVEVYSTSISVVIKSTHVEYK